MAQWSSSVSRSSRWWDRAHGSDLLTPLCVLSLLSSTNLDVVAGGRRSTIREDGECGPAIGDARGTAASRAGRPFTTASCFRAPLLRRRRRARRILNPRCDHPDLLVSHVGWSGLTSWPAAACRQDKTGRRPPAPRWLALARTAARLRVPALASGTPPPQHLRATMSGTEVSSADPGPPLLAARRSIAAGWAHGLSASSCPARGRGVAHLTWSRRAGNRTHCFGNRQA